MERHKLTSVDPEHRTATCSICGPTGIRSRGEGRGWRCRKGANRYKRHPGEVRRSTRRAHRASVGDRCNRCGFEAEHPALLDVHHRDGDHNNNDPANLETLCPICHRREHLGI